MSGYNVDLDLGDLFERAFGHSTPAFSSDLTPVEGNLQFRRVETGTVAGSPYYATDPELNVEYYMPITIKYPDTAVLSAQEQELLAGGGGPGAVGRFAPSGSGSTGLMKTWNLPFPVISISSRKTIVETPLTERRGTVKELINILDYEITIRGFIINKSNEYPEADVTTLRSIYEINEALSIQCPLTDIFLLRPDRSGSDHVVITSLNFPGLKGVKNVVPYEIKMVSDEPFNLIDIS